MPLLRKAFFYLFVLIWLVICPIIILRMLGFVLDPHTHLWVKTGIIYASSNPPGASIYINGRLAPETTPAVIRDLTPGQYSLRMELEGYEPWENVVPVLDKKATSVENVLLIPKKWRIKTLSAVPLSRLVPMPGNNFLLVASDDQAQNVYILRLDKDIEDSVQSDENPSFVDLEPLLPEESIYREARVARYFTVDSSPFFILQADIGDKHKYLWIDPREKPVHIEDISDLLPEAPVKLYWEPNDEKNIYAVYSSYVNRVNIKAKAIYPNIRLKDIPVRKRPIDKLTDLPQADQLFLINNGNTLLFRRGSNVFLMNEESFSQPRLTKVLRVQDDTDVHFAERTGKLCYIDGRTHLLSAVQILHHKPFIPKPIAETLRLNKLED